MSQIAREKLSNCLPQSIDPCSCAGHVDLAEEEGLEEPRVEMRRRRNEESKTLCAVSRISAAMFCS